MEIIKLDLEHWDNFQIESDSVRQLILCYLTAKCDLFEYNNKHVIDCDKYHEEDKRRRKPFKDGKLIYESELCHEIIQNKDCISNENCYMSHNINEILYHPAKYRTVICDKKCTGVSIKFCPFAHNNEELRNGSIYTKNLNQSSNEYVPSFDLMSFKTKKCLITTKHSEKQCLGYHSAKDKRRILTKINYSPDQCIYSESDRICLNGDFCTRSHNKVEMFYHPQKFKTKFCSHFNPNSFASILDCSYGKYCSFAHSEFEIKIELMHTMIRDTTFFIDCFKTTTCPFTHSHDKSTCVYSHNWQDYRRSPLQFFYKNKACPKWDNKKTILQYKEGCSDETKCMFCHGWKEEDFHPINYKTKKCKNFSNKCQKKEFCPYYHEGEHKRKLSSKILGEYELKLKLTVKNSQPTNKLESEFNIINGIQRNNRSEIIYQSTNLFENVVNNFNKTNKNLSNDNNYIDGKKSKNSTNSNISTNVISFQNNHSVILTKNNLLNFNFNISNNSYNSFSGSNLSDNENEHKSNKSYKSNYSASSPVYSSLSDNFSGVNLNPDDSIEFNLDKIYMKNENDNDSSPNKFYIENLDMNNNLLKQLLKDSDFLISNTNQMTSNQDFMNYLHVNNFKILYQKLFTHELDIRSLNSFPDDQILCLIESENKNKFGELRALLMKLDVNMDGEDLLKTINDYDNFNAELRELNNDLDFNVDDNYDNN